MKKIITINRHNIGANQRHHTDIAPISVKVNNLIIYGHEIKILGECELIYSPRQARCNGATCWIETNAPLILVIREAGKKSQINID